ncbi:MAG TPA: NAD(P)-dependent oxidoreductase [Nocardioidaceae bacterium]|nr:NAD(P)-dependent oxidoreductase [Nocardioidaceae bacterium]
MRVAVVGATGVIGRAVVPVLLEAGHEVVGLARTPEKARALVCSGAQAQIAGLLDHDGLVDMFRGADAVCNFATHVPVGLSVVRPHAWRANDRLRTEGVRRVVAAAREARVRRIVQESVSFLYADQGDDLVTEASPLAITRATEPASVGELHVQDYVCGSRSSVVLRLGAIVGDDPMTRFQLRSARHGHAIGLGTPEGWAHVVHVDDLGTAALAALSVPSGVYNVGAEPVRRSDLMAGFAAAAGREAVNFVGPFLRRVGRERLEPLARSLRVSSDRFATQSGWSPARAHFDASWFSAVLPSGALR